MPTKNFPKLSVLKTENTKFILKSLTTAFDEANFVIPEEQKESVAKQYVGDEKETLGFIAKIKRTVTQYVTDVEHGGKLIEIERMQNIKIHPDANVILARYIAYINAIIQECDINSEQAEQTENIDNVFVLMRHIMLRLVTQALSSHNEGTQDGDKLLVVLEKFIQKCGPTEALKKQHLLYDRISQFQRALSSETHKKWMETLYFMVSQMKKLHLFSDTLEDIISRLEEYELRTLRFVLTILFPDAPAGDLNDYWIRGKLTERLQFFIKKYESISPPQTPASLAVSNPSSATNPMELVIQCYQKKILQEHKGSVIKQQNLFYIQYLFDLLTKNYALQAVLSKLLTINQILGCVPILLGIIDCDGLDKLIQAFDLNYRECGVKVFGPFKESIPQKVDYRSALGGILKQEIARSIILRELPRFATLSDTSHLNFLHQQLMENFGGIIEQQQHLQRLFSTKNRVINTETLKKINDQQQTSGYFLLTSSRAVHAIEDLKFKESSQIPTTIEKSMALLLAGQEIPITHRAALLGDLAELKRHRLSLITSPTDNCKNTIVHSAAAGNQCNIVRYCIEEKIPCHERNQRGETPLIIAAKAGYYDIVDLLLNHQGSLIQTFDEGDTLFLWGIRQLSITLIKYLLKHKISATEDKDKNGNNAFHLIAILPAEQTPEHHINFLLEHSADMKIAHRAKNHRGETPFILAGKNHHLTVVHFLMKLDQRCLDDRFGDLQDTLWLWAAKNGRQELMELLYQHDHNIIKQRDRYGNTALHKATAAGDLILVNWLLKIGLHHTERNFVGQTPFLVAIVQGRQELADYFYQKFPAILQKKDANLNTALHLAVRYSHIGLVEWLLTCTVTIAQETPWKLSLTSKNNNGYTAIELAQELQKRRPTQITSAILGLLTTAATAQTATIARHDQSRLAPQA